LGLEDLAVPQAFEKLGEYLSLTELSEKEVIRFAGEVELHSHVLIEGLVGMFQNGRLVRLFFPGDMFMDYESYVQQLPSRYEIRCLEDSVFTSLDFNQEQEVLKNIPEFREVSEHLIQRIRFANEQWVAFTQLHHLERIEQLEARKPNIRIALKRADLANILGVSESTVQRMRSKKDEPDSKTPSWKRQLMAELRYSFKHALHPKAQEIEGVTLAWATCFHNLLRTPEEIKGFESQKLSLLSSYLYPETELDTAIWISKLYTWLFYLDDQTDRIPRGQKTEFWKFILLGLEKRVGEEVILPARIRDLVLVWEELRFVLPELENMCKPKINLVEKEVLDFIHYNLKEAKLKDEGIVQDPESFLIDKPFYSGARLAVNLTCLDIGNDFGEDSEEWEKSKGIRELGERLIFLSNDLISYRKEKNIGDSMNIIAVWMRQNNLNFLQAQEKVLNQFHECLREFLRLDLEIRSNHDPGNIWLLHCLKQVKYKVAGSNYWSLHESNRYE
jgi:CRP-like cAMP-binding protein